MSSALFVGIPVVCLSPLHGVERMHLATTHIYTHFPYNCHLHSLSWARLHHTKVACHTSWIVVALALTDLETRRFGILLFHSFFRLVPSKARDPLPWIVLVLFCDCWLSQETPLLAVAALLQFDTYHRPGEILALKKVMFCLQFVMLALRIAAGGLQFSPATDTIYPVCQIL